MKTPTLDQQFLSHLSLKQKRQVWKYYLLITHPDMDADRQIEQISQIWSLAEADDRLMEWLEFIDYFYADPEDDEDDQDERAVDASRAYLSEYLAEQVELSTMPIGSYLPSFFQCPKGKGYVAIPRNSREPYDSATFQQQRCKNCGYELGQHAQVQPDVSLPEA